MVSEILDDRTEEPTPNPNGRAKNRLPDTPFSQQEVPNWQPTINFKTAWPLLCLIGVLFIICGILVFYFSVQNQEISITYTSPESKVCTNAINELKIKRGICEACSKSGNDSPKICNVKFDVSLAMEMKLPVYMYYEIGNFHQNHRRYVKSRDDNQLLGKIGNADNPIDPSRNCAPFDKNGKGLRYFPCGAMANSMFSDSLEINLEGHDAVNLSAKTAWTSERSYKFRNPSGVKNLEDFKKKEYLDHFTKPKEWSEEFWNEWWRDGGLRNDKFINWMRPAPLSKFRKLYGTIDSVPGCQKKQYLCMGTYNLKVGYRFDVDRFKGTKVVILSKTSFLGTENQFVGAFTIVVGAVMLIFGTIFCCVNNRHKSRVHPGQRRVSVNRNNHVLPRPTA